MTAVTAGQHPRPRTRFGLIGPTPGVAIALGVIMGGIVVAVIYGFSLTLAVGTIAAVPVLYALNVLVWRANNYVILHDDRLDLKMWELGDLGPGLKIPYESITAVRVHPTDDLLQVRYVYDDGEQAGATVEMRRDDALELKDEILRRRNQARISFGRTT